jgi:hypothetical protein
MTGGSAGIGLITVAVPWWVVLIVLLVLAFGAWKVVKFVWSMFGS